MPRYIDADIVSEGIEKLQTELESNNDVLWKKNKPIYKGLCYARGIINDTPTADVVAVVRCKDCVHCREYMNFRMEKYLGCNSNKVSPTHFCAYGVRKDETAM